MVTFLMGVALLGAENSKPISVDTLDMATIATIEKELNQTLDQAIWNGINKLQAENTNIEFGIVEIVLNYGEPIYATVNLKMLDQVDSGNMTPRDYIRNYVKFQ